MSKQPQPSRPKDKRPPKDKPPFPPKDPRIDLREHARQVVADWPPLTAEQRDHLAVLFRPAMQEVRARKQRAA